MDLQTVSILKSILFIIIFILPSHFFIPKALIFWQKWKDSKKVCHVSNFVSMIAASFFCYFILLVIGVMRLLGLA